MVISYGSISDVLAEEVLICGKAFSESSVFIEKLQGKGLEPRIVSVDNLKEASSKQSRLLILGASDQFDPEVRRIADQYLRDGGNIILCGSEGFDYSPKPINATPIVDFNQASTYQIIRRKRKVKPGSLEHEKTKVIFMERDITAIEFSTQHRAMHDVMVQIPLQGKSSRSRSVLKFRAKGNPYMDLLALEIVDSQGINWYSFVPLTSQWDNYAVSLADFIPENFSEDDKTYPLLTPEGIDTLWMGVNLMTVWKEKAMYFALSDISLAENANPFYTPTSALKALRLPFLENGINSPSWLFDPMFQSKFIHNKEAIVCDEYFLPGKTTIENVNFLCHLPENLVEHPGSRMGTDVAESYDLRNEREKRIIPVLTTSNKGIPANIAQLNIYAGGRYAGSTVGLWGIDPLEIISKTQLMDVLGECIVFILRNPVVTAVKINTTQVRRKVNEVTPLLKITLKNPTSKRIDGKISIVVANGKLKADDEVKIPAYGVTVQDVELPLVPDDFPIEKFNWEVILASDHGTDILRDSVDTERSLLLAFRHIIKAQEAYPDGRISHHYFGDAYGVRAMFGYLDLLRKQPERGQNNKDLWKSISTNEIEKAAFCFCDMLAERQTPEGALPMGYSEHSGGYNVADGGQIALSLIQSVQYISDPERKKLYANLAFRFADWAEEFYIDRFRSEELAFSEPEEYKKGNAFPGMYGLGQYGRKRKLTGPSWVGADILALQIALANTNDPRSGKYQNIAERNIRFYVNAMYSAAGYYQAEALFWAWLNSSNQSIRARIVKNLQETFIPPLLRGVENDMFELGGRRTLNALPLLYYQRYIENSAAVRAVLLKYAWTLGSESSYNSVGHLSNAFPKPVHGESLAAVKYAALSALWCMEILYPESTLLQYRRTPETD